jgi:hypothetical protein
MALRTAHGRARDLGAIAVVETLPADELPKGTPDPHRSAQPPRMRGRRFEAADPHTVAAAQAGGRARAGRTLLAHTLAVTSDDPEWRKLLGQAEAFRSAQVKQLRETVGGGMCGPAPAALVANAALALAGSRLAYARGNVGLGAKLGAEVRQHLLGALELAAREAAVRKPTENSDFAAQARQLREGKPRA